MEDRFCTRGLFVDHPWLLINKSTSPGLLCLAAVRHGLPIHTTIPLPLNIEEVLALEKDDPSLASDSENG